MITNNQSPTPETDAQMVAHYGDGLGQWVTRDFARKLERERNEARQQLAASEAKAAELQKDKERLDWIESLSDAGEIEDQKDLRKAIDAAMKQGGKG
jgi:hypothetical protein